MPLTYYWKWWWYKQRSPEIWPGVTFVCLCKYNCPFCVCVWERERLNRSIRIFFTIWKFIWNMNIYREVFQYKSTVNKENNSVEQSPSFDTNKCSASREMSCLLWNLNTHIMFIRAHHWTQFWARLILSILYFSTMHFKIILPPIYQKWSLPFRLSDQNF
jgi:hypothetical protein